MSAKPQPVTREPLAVSSAGPLDHVLEALSHLRYGAIQLTVHDGRLVQVDVTERRRFP